MPGLKDLLDLSKENKLQADAKSDIEVKEAANKAWEIFSGFLRRMQSKQFLEKGENQEPLRYRLGKGISFLPEQSFYLDLSHIYDYGTPENNAFLALGILPDGTLNTYNSNRGIFLPRGIGSRPTVVVYLSCKGVKEGSELNFDDPTSNFKYGLVLEQVKHNSVLKSVFVHEFTHLYDEIRYRKKGSKKPPPKYYDHSKNYTKYINHPLELNARYMESINAILDSFTRLLKVRQNGIKGAFPTFEDFFKFYWVEPGYIPPALKNHISNKNSKRFMKRFYKFYDFITKDEEFNADQAREFARIQAERDAELEEIENRRNTNVRRNTR